MKAVVIYESLTGNTRRAAELIGAGLRQAGFDATVCSVMRVDYQALSAADLVVVGSWTDGLVFFGQRPGRASRLHALPAMTGKWCVVFCTYAIDPGKTLQKLEAIMAGRGADVLGGKAIKRTNIPGGVDDLVAQIRKAVTTV